MKEKEEIRFYPLPLNIVCPSLSKGEGDPNFEKFKKLGTWKKKWDGWNQKGREGKIFKKKGETLTFQVEFRENDKNSEF